MSKQAVMEPAPAQVAEPQDDQAAPSVTALSADTVAGVADEALIAEELLVEEVSIDGMCGVY
jgi:mycofactocin precursor